MTPNEVEFLYRLERALPQYRVFPQVSMGALIGADTYQQRMQFAMKIVDFVICRLDMSVVCIIELDDATHNPLKDLQRDALTRKAGYTTIRWQSRHKPAPAEIAEMVSRIVAGR